MVTARNHTQVNEKWLKPLVAYVGVIRPIAVTKTDTTLITQVMHNCNTENVVLRLSAVHKRKFFMAIFQ